VSRVPDRAALDAIAGHLGTARSDATALDAVRAVVARTGRRVPSIRQLLDLSTAHLPEAVLLHLADQPGVVAHPTGYGAFLWVPPDPDEWFLPERPPDEVVAVQRLARSLGCDWVAFDCDAPEVSGLPTWTW
jgi:hypothetical protein